MSEYEFEVVVGLVFASCVINFIAFKVLFDRLAKLTERARDISHIAHRTLRITSLVESRSKFLMETKERHAATRLEEVEKAREEMEELGLYRAEDLYGSARYRQTFGPA